MNFIRKVLFLISIISLSTPTLVKADNVYSHFYLHSLIHPESNAVTYKIKNENSSKDNSNTSQNSETKEDETKTFVLSLGTQLNTLGALHLTEHPETESIQTNGLGYGGEKSSTAYLDFQLGISQYFFMNFAFPLISKGNIYPSKLSLVSQLLGKPSSSSESGNLSLLVLYDFMIQNSKSNLSDFTSDSTLADSLSYNSNSRIMIEMGYRLSHSIAPYLGIAWNQFTDFGIQRYNPSGTMILETYHRSFNYLNYIMGSQLLSVDLNQKEGLRLNVLAEFSISKIKKLNYDNDIRSFAISASLSLF